MSFYEKHILPHVIHKVCGLKPTMIQRGKVVPHAIGKVLEIGIGSGLNIPYYNADAVDSLVAIDPYPNLKQLDKAMELSPLQIELRSCDLNDANISHRSIDTVVTTYTFCTIPELNKTLQEVKKILKPNGQLLFVEHGKSPDKDILKKQNRINPIWKRISGGCQLNLDIPNYLTSNGFQIKNLETMYIPGWKPATYNFWGSAHIR